MSPETPFGCAASRSLHHPLVRVRRRSCGVSTVVREQNRTGRSLTRSIRENTQDTPCSSVGGSTFWYSVACASAHSSRERCEHAACLAFRVAFTLLHDCDGARLPLRRRTRQTLQHVNAGVSLEVLAERRVVLNETRISIACASAKRRTVRALHALEVLVAWQRRRRVATLMRNVPHGSEVARLCAQRREYITPRADRRRRATRHPHARWSRSHPADCFGQPRRSELSFVYKPGVILRGSIPPGRVDAGVARCAVNGYWRQPAGAV